MYTQKEIKKAIDTYLTIGSVKGTIRALGYPSRTTFHEWLKEYFQTGEVKAKNNPRGPKRDLSKEKAAVDHYLQNGRSIVGTMRALGYPRSPVTLRAWIRKHAPQAIRAKVPASPKPVHSAEVRLAAVTALRRKKFSAIQIAREYGISRNTLYAWDKEFPAPPVSSERPKPMASKQRKIAPLSASTQVTQAQSCSSAVPPSTPTSSELSVEQRLENALEQVALLSKQVDALNAEAQALQEDVYKLRMQKDVLVKCAELIKKDPGVNLESLSNREKTQVIDALRCVYKLADLLSILAISKSSYCYQRKSLRAPDKYAEHREAIKEIFQSNYRCYGYRRIKAALNHHGVRISEKVVRRLMYEEGLKVLNLKRRKYSSYKGEISPEVSNVLNRNFRSNVPNEKWVTDITEFALSDGKVYFSPIIDCYDGMPVAWTAGTSPNANLVNQMVSDAIATLGPDEKPIIHSDRGCHYRWPGWIEITEKAGLVRSMSKKGCSPDNAACEGFFGRMKNEMFYGRSWAGTTCSEFIQEIEEYMEWYINDRIKLGLGGKSIRSSRLSNGMI